jgi:hypothetical protein
MLNKNLVIAALVASAQGQAAKAATTTAAKTTTTAAKTTTTAAKTTTAAATTTKAATTATTKAAATTTAKAVTREAWEDLLGRDLCDDWGTTSWEKAAAELAKQKAAVTKLTAEIAANAKALGVLQDAADKANADLNGQAAAAAVTAVARVLNADGSQKTAQVKAAAAKTAVQGTAPKLLELKAQKVLVDGVVTELPKTWAKEAVLTTAIKDGGATEYGKLKALVTSASLQTQVTTVLAKAAALDMADLALANGNADKAGSDMIDTAGATNPAPGGFLAARKAADLAWRTAVADGATADYDLAQWTAQTTTNSYLFRVASRIAGKTEWDPKCEGSVAAQDNTACRLLEGGTLNAAMASASASVYSWPTNNNCDVGVNGATAKCRMRGL